MAVVVKFPAEFKGVPLGELPNEVRLRGFYAFSLRNFSMKSTSLSTPSAGIAL